MGLGRSARLARSHRLVGKCRPRFQQPHAAIAIGLSNPKKIYNALEKLVNASGIGDVTQFFNDPDGPEFQPPPPPPPDPQTVLAQAQAQALGQEQQRKGMEAQQTHEYNMTKLQADAGDKQAQRELERMDKELEAMRIRTQAASDDRKQTDAEITSEHERENIDADTELKRAQTRKTGVEASATAVESSEAYKGAKEIVESEGDNDAGTAETEDE